jgi:hypothetical protein
MKLYLVTRSFVHVDYMHPKVDLEVYAFSSKEYADTYVRLYGTSIDNQIEVELDEKVPEMKQLIDELAIRLQSAITVPCKV